MDKKLYCCVGCREIHYDNDYNFEQGDLLLSDWKKFLKSIDRVKGEIPSSKQIGTSDKNG